MYKTIFKKNRFQTSTAKGNSLTCVTPGNTGSSCSHVQSPLKACFDPGQTLMLHLRPCSTNQQSNCIFTYFLYLQPCQPVTHTLGQPDLCSLSSALSVWWVCVYLLEWRQVCLSFMNQYRFHRHLIMPQSERVHHCHLSIYQSDVTSEEWIWLCKLSAHWLTTCDRQIINKKAYPGADLLLWLLNWKEKN